jgi:hypothetical protein
MRRWQRHSDQRCRCETRKKVFHWSSPDAAKAMVPLAADVGSLPCPNQGSHVAAEITKLLYLGSGYHQQFDLNMEKRMLFRTIAVAGLVFAAWPVHADEWGAIAAYVESTSDGCRVGSGSAWNYPTISQAQNAASRPMQ